MTTTDKKQRNNTPKTAWKPGQSGNPNGRPKKGYSITETIKSMLKSKPEIKKALSTKILEKGLQGDMAAIRMLWSYMDGLPLARHEHSGDADRPLGVVILPKIYDTTDQLATPSGAADRSSEED